MGFLPRTRRLNLHMNRIQDLGGLSHFRALEDQLRQVDNGFMYCQDEMVLGIYNAVQEWKVMNELTYIKLILILYIYVFCLCLFFVFLVCRPFEPGGWRLGSWKLNLAWELDMPRYKSQLWCYVVATRIDDEWWMQPVPFVFSEYPWTVAVPCCTSQ